MKRALTRGPPAGPSVKRERPDLRSRRQPPRAPGRPSTAAPDGAAARDESARGAVRPAPGLVPRGVRVYCIDADTRFFGMPFLFQFPAWAPTPVTQRISI